MPIEIKVLSSLATREAYLELAPQFEKASGHTVATTWAGTVDITSRMAAGEVYDLVISSSKSVGELIRQGRLVPDSQTNLAKTGIGMAVRKGAPRPALGSADDLKKALLAAKTIGYSTGPSGVYLQSLFERLGVADAVRGKVRQVPTGGTVAGIVASGEAEIGFQQVSELHGDEIDFVGPLPPDVQNITVFAAGIHAKAPHPEAAAALAAFLVTPAASAVMMAHGLETP